MQDVFISYSSKDYNQAYSIRAYLMNQGITCWMAPDSIPAGSNYSKEIPLGIRDSQVFLLLLSGNALSSRWVVKELDSAINKGKHIVPFVLDDCTLTDEFEFLLTGCQCKYANKPNALVDLTNQILARTGKKPVPPKPVTPTAAPQNPPVRHVGYNPNPGFQPVPPAKPKKNNRGLLIAMAISLVLLVFGSVILYSQHAAKQQASYRTAESLLDDRNYEHAIEVFRKLGNYKDSAERVKKLEQLQADYDAAVTMLNNRKYADAYNAFQALGTYRDSVEKSDYAHTLYKLDASFETWFDSGVTANVGADGKYYATYTNDTDYAFDLYAVIRFYDANDNLLEKGEVLTLHIARGATVSIPVIPTTITDDEWFAWNITWDFDNIT